MPVEQIDAAVATVEHPIHKDYLREHLGNLAHAAALEAAESDEWPAPEDIFEKYAREERTQRITSQANLTSIFFSSASKELGAGASEDAVWNMVFESQLSHLRNPYNSPEVRASVAGNLLVTNLFAVYGKPPKEAKEELDRRMWQVARTETGLTVLEAAGKNKDLCVVSDDPDTPYRSVAEQVSEFSTLFVATAKDPAVSRNIDTPVKVLGAADIEDKAWFFGKAAEQGKHELIEANRQYIGETEAPQLTRLALKSFSGNLEDFNRAGIGEPLKAVDLAAELIRDDQNPLYLMDIRNMPAADQQDIFHLMADHKQPAAVAQMLYSRNFNKLDASCLQRVLDLDLTTKDTSLPLTAFTDLPSGTFDKVMEAGFNTYQVVEAIDSFDMADREHAYEVLLNSDESHFIFSNPDKFPFVPKDKLLEQARQKGQFWAVAGNIDKWTDGSDKEFIQEAIEVNNSGWNIAARISKLPGLDREWFLGELQEREDYNALQTCMNHMPELDQGEIFDGVLKLDMRDSMLQYSLDNYTQLSPSEILQKLADAKAYNLIASNRAFFTEETPESLSSLMIHDPAGREALAERLVLFPNIDRRWMAESLLADNNPEAAARSADEIVDGGVDVEWLYSQIRDSKSGMEYFISQTGSEACRSAIGIDRLYADCLKLDDLSVMAHGLEIFKTPEMQAAFVDACIAKKDYNNLIFNLRSLDVPPIDIAKRCIAAGWEQPVASCWSEFYFLEGLDADEVPTAQDLLTWGAPAVLLANNKMYPDAPVDVAFDMLLARGDDDLLAEVVTSYQDGRIPNTAATRLLETDHIWILRHKKEQFDPSVFSIDFLERYLESGDQGFAEVYAYSGHNIDWIDKGMRDFGKDAPPALLGASREINRSTDENLPDYLTELGVSNRGPAGIDQLRAADARIRRQLLETATDPEALADFARLTTTNIVAMNIAQRMTRFTNSEWGKHGQDEWNRLLQAQLDTSAGQAPMRPEFVPSREYTIHSLDAKAFDPSTIDEDARNRYDVLKADVGAAYRLVEHPGRNTYAGLFTQGRTVLRQELDRLQQQREKWVAEGNDRAIIGIDRKTAVIN
jgi:hypothetical protein